MRKKIIINNGSRNTIEIVKNQLIDDNVDGTNNRYQTSIEGLNKLNEEKSERKLIKMSSTNRLKLYLKPIINTEELK